MECIILAGGFGTRLSHLLDNRPKTLAPINNKPFLDYLMQYLIRNGINKFIFSLGHLSDQVIDFIKMNYETLDYDYVIDPFPLGTGGAIRLAIEKCKEDSVLIVNADTFFNVDLKEMNTFHQNNISNCTFALKPLTNYDRYGTVEIDNNMKITNFIEKKYTEKGLINGGYIILNKKILIDKFNLNKVFSFEKDFIETYFNEINSYGYVSNEYFIDIGIPEDYYKANIDFVNSN